MEMFRYEATTPSSFFFKQKILLLEECLKNIPAIALSTLNLHGNAKSNILRYS